MKINLLIALAGMVLVIGQSNCLTPLMDAVLKNNLSEVKKLIKSGVKVNEKDDYGTTALYAAADGASVDIAKILIKHRADVNAKDKHGDTPLISASGAWYALHKKDKSEREKLLDDAAETVKLLLEHGAKVNETDNDGFSALMFSASSTPKIVMLLLKHGAEVNAKNNYGDTALFQAAGASKPDIVELLIKHRADVNAKDKDGWTAIIPASMVSSAAFTHDQAEKQKRFDDAAKVVKLLIDKGADVNVKDAYVGATALMHASMIGAIPVAKILIAKGADIKAKDKFGNTALDYAKKAKQTEMVKFLEEKMAASGSRAE